MQKKYNKFNLISLLIIVVFVFFLALSFSDSDKKVEFFDQGLESAIRKALDNEKNDILYRDVQKIQILDASNHEIKSLDGIESLTVFS